MRRPVLVVGDVQGDVERLREGLLPYPEDEHDTVFLGDFFQGGKPGAGGGAAAARLARERRNSRAVLGNHDLFLLAMLERRRGVPEVAEWQTRTGIPVEELWLSRRGDWADLDAVAGDEDLERWLRDLPLMLRLDDGTIVQHSDDDQYMMLGAGIDAVNAAARALLAQPGGVLHVLRYTIGRHAFEDPSRVDRYLAHFAGTRIVHGHTPHFEDAPLVAHGGRVISYDGRFSRYWSPIPGDSGPVTATIALLPELGA